MKKINAIVILVLCGALSACAGFTPRAANFEAMDIDRNRVLTADEVLPIYGQKEFNLMDTNGSGDVTHSEYNRYPNQAYGV